MANTEIFLTVVLAMLAIAVIGLVLYSLVRSRRRRYAARELGFMPLAGADVVFRDQVAAPYLAAQPRYLLDSIFYKAGNGYRLYSYDVYPPGGGVHHTLAIVDDRLDLPRFSITGRSGQDGEAEDPAQPVLGGPLAASPATALAFPEHPAFDAGYLVTGRGDSDVHRVLAVPVLDWLAALRYEPGMRRIAIWGAGPRLVWGWDDAGFDSLDQAANLQTSLDRLVKLHELLSA